MRLHGGRVSKCYEFWKTICRDRTVLKHVGGITIPFTEDVMCQTFRPPELRFSAKERRFVRQTLQDLVQTGCIVPLKQPKKDGWHSNIFLRPKCNGSYRMILNLKPLNKFIQYKKFKMPNIYTVMSMVKPNDQLMSIDLSNAYSSLKIRESHQKFLQFSFEGRHYMYLVLPNGIAIGPHVFVETTKAITRFLRKRGVNMIIYIDDTLLIDKCPTTLGNHTQLALQTCQKCGFVINFEKSQLHLSTKAEFLGFWFDTVAFTITLTEAKTEVALKLVRKLLRVKFKCRIRLVAKVIGTLVAVFPCCEDGPLYYRSLERDKMKAIRVTGSWNACMVLSNSGREELQWWNNVLTRGPPSKSLKQRSYNIHFYSDVTLEGWGVLIKGVNANGTFSEKQSSLSINTKELLAIYYGLASFKNHITGQNILCHCDNTTAVSCIVKKGSSDKIRNAITKKDISAYSRNTGEHLLCTY